MPYLLSKLAEGFVGRKDFLVREPVFAKLRPYQTLEEFWREEFSADPSAHHEWKTWKEWEKRS